VAKAQIPQTCQGEVSLSVNFNKKKALCDRNGVHTPVNPALERLRQENCEFNVSLGYIYMRPCLKKRGEAGRRGKGRGEKLFFFFFLS
jgi:hypothetical protein